MIPQLHVETGQLPLGRYAATLEQVKERFVSDPEFKGSGTRRGLWDEWEMHRLSIEALIGTRPRLWVGGSFVTSKMDPKDVDVFYGFDSNAYGRIPQDDLEDLENLLTLEWCVENNMRIDSHGARLPDNIPVDILMPSLLNDKNKVSFQWIGIFDELWQRCKATGKTSVDAARRRGYLEVQW